MSQKKPETRLEFRSAVSGRFVKDTYGKQHPKTTERERVPLPGKGRK